MANVLVSHLSINASLSAADRLLVDALFSLSLLLLGCLLQVVAAQLGSACHWMGTSTDPENDTEAAFAHAEMATLGVDCSTCSILPSGSMPVSVRSLYQAVCSSQHVYDQDGMA